MRKLFSFWSGAELGFIEHLCIRSMLSSGHELTIYSFDELPLPSGVELRDAGEILDRSKIVKHKQTGSLALFSDLFRYAGLKNGAGIWTDLDVFFLRNIDDLGDVIVGFEDTNVINGAVLYLDPHAPCLASLIEFSYSNPVIAPWWKAKRRFKELVLRTAGKQRRIEDMEWGIIGPAALTYFIPACGLKAAVQPIEVLSPVSYRQVPRLLAPADGLPDLVTSRSRTIHLYRSTLMRRPDDVIPRNCYLADLAARMHLPLPETFNSPWRPLPINASGSPSP